jgi:hypothetical protein
VIFFVKHEHKEQMKNILRNLLKDIKFYYSVLHLLLTFIKQTIQLPIYRVLAVIFPKLKRTERENDH